MTVPLRCPSCDADLDAGPGLPLFGLEGARQSRVIRVFDHKLQRFVRWRCPDCSHEWDR